jgi:translation elongation factor EF-Ts
VGELIASKIARFGENITVTRFLRFKVGEKAGGAGADAAPTGVAQ